jgi:CubicO group peptidase (beta-lactamase class C family)
VATAFERILVADRAGGASLGVYRDGRPVVELWGGLMDSVTARPWQRDTITPLASTGKTLATAAALLLVERGLLDLDAPVARYWPAFGQAGKEDILVRWVLAHRSGVAALARAVSNDDAVALDPILRAIEAQAPWWPPGTRHGYHAMTYGFLISGIVRAVTGLTVGEFFAREIAAPLALDLHAGLPREEHGRVAPMVAPGQWRALASMVRPAWIPFLLATLDRRSVTYRAAFGGTTVSFDDTDELRRYEVEDASSGAVGNGPSLARLFAALEGEVDGIRLISPGLMERVRHREASGRDEVLRMRTDWGLGFALPGGPQWPDPGVPGLFGHTGASGSLAFADPEHHLAFGYTPNRWVEIGGLRGGFRFERLVAAVYASIGVDVGRG